MLLKPRLASGRSPSWGQDGSRRATYCRDQFQPSHPDKPSTGGPSSSSIGTRTGRDPAARTDEPCASSRSRLYAQIAPVGTVLYSTSPSTPLLLFSGRAVPERRGAGDRRRACCSSFNCRAPEQQRPDLRLSRHAADGLVRSSRLGRRLSWRTLVPAHYEPTLGRTCSMPKARPSSTIIERLGAHAVVPPLGTCSLSHLRQERQAQGVARICRLDQPRLISRAAFGSPHGRGVAAVWARVDPPWGISSPLEFHPPRAYTTVRRWQQRGSRRHDEPQRGGHDHRRSHAPQSGSALRMSASTSDPAAFDHHAMNFCAASACPALGERQSRVARGALGSGTENNRFGFHCPV